MLRFIFILAILIIMSGCNNPTEERTAENVIHIDSTEISDRNDSLLYADKMTDTITADVQIPSTEKINMTQDSDEVERSRPTRYIEFPGDAQFNDKPMTQQEEIPKEIIEEHPDTLSKLAIARYKTYDKYFPVSIADNFEEGISTEHIHYPEKLIFRFELFEDEYSWTPYSVKQVIVRRKPNGELYTE